MAPPTLGKIKNIDIDDEMRSAYLDYAMSVIVARALPDVRDGLKPVHRRIMYAMHTMGLTHDKPHRKSARIVGEVLGKYHPHGDVAVYDAMVRLAQDFSMRYPLVDGQGNFGSIDGDSAAAMRYTEARLSQIASEMLRDIEKETVDFTPNFDDTLTEPEVLPAAIPNLLLNGSSGIAVGMSTNIPPHNLGEVIDALTFMIDHYHAVDDITLDHLMYFIKGPDFPTGGIVYRFRDGKEGREDAIAKAYASGRGQFVMQAKVHVETMTRGRDRLVVTELPYQTDKSRLIERIAELAREGRLEGLSDLRDESDRQGMRLVIELTRTTDAKEVLAQLYKLTPMQQTFGVSLLALVDDEPRQLSLKRMLHLYLEHRQEIVRRRSEYDLARARERAHILEGLLIALANLDEVIAIIRSSANTEAARTRLMDRFKLSEIQAQAILDMPLKRLSKLEREKLEAEHKELKQRIAYLVDLLAHPEKMLLVIREELLAIKAQYGDSRRTQIADVQGKALTVSEFLSEEEVLILLTKSGLLFQQSLAGRRRGTLPRKVADAPIALAAAPARDTAFLFTAAGQAVSRRIHQLPAEESAVHFSELVDLRNDDEIVAMLALSDAEPADGAGERSLLLYTRSGRCKRVAVSELLSAAHTNPVVMNVEAGDALAGVLLCDSEDDLLMISRLGQSIRFGLDDVRVMGLPAAGVLAMKLSDGDEIVGAGLCTQGREVVLLTTNGFGMRSAVEQYPAQKRYGSGVIAMRLSRQHGAVEAAAVIDNEAEMFVISRKGSMRVLRLDDAPRTNRGGSGRQLPALADAEVQRLLAVVIPKVKEGESAPELPPSLPPLPAPPAEARSTESASQAEPVAAPPKARESGKSAGREDGKPESPKAGKSASGTTLERTQPKPTPTTKAAPAKPAAAPPKPQSNKPAAPSLPLFTPDETGKPGSAKSGNSKTGKSSGGTTLERTQARPTAAPPKPKPSPPAAATLPLLPPEETEKPETGKAGNRKTGKPAATEARPGSFDAIKQRVRKKQNES